MSWPCSRLSNPLNPSILPPFPPPTTPPLFSSFFISSFLSLPFLFFHSIEDGSSVYVGASRQKTPHRRLPLPSPPPPLSSFLPTVSNSLEKSDAARAGRSPFGTEASVQRFASGATILRFADDMSDASLVAAELLLLKSRVGNVRFD